MLGCLVHVAEDAGSDSAIVLEWSQKRNKMEIKRWLYSWKRVKDEGSGAAGGITASCKPVSKDFISVKEGLPIFVKLFLSGIRR